MHASRFVFSALLLGAAVIAHAEPADIKTLKGDWHLKVMDGYNVRKARAILDFHPDTMRLEGFDSCNRITGKLQKHKDGTYTATLTTTRMACRNRLTSFVSKRLHETIETGFQITSEKRYEMEGITIKSKKHDLFFRRMGE